MLDQTMRDADGSAKPPGSPWWPAGITLAVSLVLHAIAVSRHWDADLAEAHAFRQTQTALGARSIARGGPVIDYEIPVFGPPWSLPFEFPAYQWLVAAVHNVVGLPLEQSGRIVALAAFYLCLVPCYGLLRILGSSRQGAVLGVCFVLVSPLYIFWSRTFMIESTALLLTLLYVVGTMRSRTNTFATSNLLPVAFGVLAALVKITTFAVGWGLLLLWTAQQWRRTPRGLEERAAPVRRMLVLLIVPLVPGLWWTNYADQVRAQNPAAEGTTSAALREWTFGTVEQRTTADSLFRAIDFGLLNVAGRLLLPLAAGGALWLLHRERSRGSWVLLAVFVSGPIVFTNLYVVHDYYWYAVGAYLLLWVGLQFGHLVDDPPGGGERWVAWGTAWIVLGLTWMTAADDVYSSVDEPRATYVASLGNQVESLTERDEVILILGMDWNPSLAYFADRPAVMLPGWLDAEGYVPDALRRVRAAGMEIGAVVLTGSFRSVAVPPETRQLTAIDFGQAAYKDDHSRIYSRPTELDTSG